MTASRHGNEGMPTPHFFRPATPRRPGIGLLVASLLSCGPVPPAAAWQATVDRQAAADNEREFTPEAHRMLVRTNWVRTAAWTARGAMVVFGLAEGG